MTKSSIGPRTRLGLYALGLTALLVCIVKLAVPSSQAAPPPVAPLQQAVAISYTASPVATGATSATITVNMTVGSSNIDRPGTVTLDIPLDPTVVDFAGTFSATAGTLIPGTDFAAADLTAVRVPPAANGVRVFLSSSTNPLNARINSGTGTFCTITVPLLASAPVGSYPINVSTIAPFETALNQALADGGGTIPFTSTPGSLLIVGATITVPGGTITLPATTVGTPGTGTSFNISATTLTPAAGNITVTAPTNVEVSPDGAAWSGSFTIPYTGGALASTAVFARLAGTGASGTISGNIGFSGGGATANQAVSGALNCPTITVTNPATTTGTAGTAFSQTFTASGGTAPYTFVVASGTLPTGLTLSTAGVLSGTPTQSGNFPITVRATDTANCQGTGPTYTLVISCPTVTVTPSSLPGGAVGTAYSQTISATPTGGGYTFTVTAGSLPPGLTLASATGVLSGTPTTTGTFNFTVTATGFGSCTGTQAYTVAIACPTITVNPETLPAGTAGTAYSQAISATGGTAPITFAVTAGALPGGVTLNPTTGVLSGTPTAAGTFNFTVTATDSTPSNPPGTPCTGTRAYSLVINCPTVTVSPTTLPAGTVGTAYSQTITATPAGATFAVTAGGLPGGLTLSSGGVLSGTPTANGAFNFTVTATVFGTCTGSQAYTLSINCPGLGLTPVTLPGGTVGTAYSQTFTGSGGTAPYSFTIVGGTLPPGLTLASGGGLTGTPTTTGTFNFNVQVTDSTTPTACTASFPRSITIGCPTIAVNPATLPAGTAATAYSQTLTGAGGTAPYTFAVTAGALPGGLTLSTAGVLSGTPTATGTFNFTVTATDATPSNPPGTPCTGTRAYSLTINCPTIALTPASPLPAGTAGTAYSQTIGATPTGGSYTFAVTAGSLPPGLTLASGGALTGTPTQAGTFNFTITATGFGTCTGTQAYSLTINCPTVTLSPASPLPGGSAGAPYSQTLTAAPAGGSYTFAVTAGTLPQGLTLSAAGVISGTPTVQGTFNFTVTATGFGSCTGSQAYSLTTTCPAITVNPTTIPNGTAAVAYSQTFTATGTLGTPAFTVSGGALPAGLTLSTAGVLSGTPTVIGTFNFTVRATDTNAGTNTCFGERAYSLVLGCPTITVNPPVLPSIGLNVPYSQTVTGAGGIAPYTFAVTAGALPPGIVLSTGGVLSGTSGVLGSYTFTITATDANGCTGSRSYTVQVGGVELSLLYVPDTDNSRIQVFDGATWTLAPGTSGVLGGGPGQFRSPEGVVASRTGQIYVADTGNNRIHWYNGTTWSDFATIGSGLNQVRAPQAVSLDVTGQFLFVADTGNSRVLRFNATAPNTAGVVIAGTGTGPGQVNGPRGLAVDSLGNLFISDTTNNRVLRVANATTVATANTGTLMTNVGQVRGPEGIALDNDGNLYIADTGNSRILQLPGAAPGAGVTLATLGTVLGQVRSAEGVTVANFATGPLAGRQLVVGDTANSRIESRPLAGGPWVLVTGPAPQSATLGSGIGQFRSPSKVR